MVSILPAVESFGSKVGRGLGEGLSQGIGHASDFASQIMLENHKAKKRQELVSGVEQGKSSGAPSQQEISKKFIEALPSVEQKLGRELAPQEVDQLWSSFSQSIQQEQKQGQGQEEDPFRKAKQYAAAGEHELARVASEEAKLSQKLKFEEKKESNALAKPTLERGRKLLEDLPYKESALATMKDAISSGNLGMFSLDNLAEITGIEGLRSPEGAEFKTASKEFFLGNLSRVGARGLNQMMERVVQEMGPLIGRKTEANLAVSEILEAENDVGRRESELIDEIGQAYKEKHGHYPENLQHRVYKELRPYAERRQKEALSNIDKIKEKYSPKNKEGILMYDPSGSLRRVPFNEKKEALKEGYRMP